MRRRRLHARSTLRVPALLALALACGPGAEPVGPGLPEGAQAPEFTLVDQYGDRFDSASLRGKIVQLDFIFTHCPDVCPASTDAHVHAMRALEPDVLDGVRFVSVTVDPERDRPGTLREYARARGADLEHWSFLTGEPEDVRAVLDRFGVSSGPDASGEIEHLLVSFLVDTEGRVAKRYLGERRSVGELAGRITRLFRTGS